MTVVAACRFREGAVVLADSRATSLPAATAQDELQKLLPLGPRVGLAYAGDVRLAGVVGAAIRAKCEKSERYRSLAYLEGYVPKVARHFFQRLGFGGLAGGLGLLHAVASCPLH